MTISTLRPKAAREWKSSKNTSHLAPISVIEKSTPKLRPESAHELAGESAETPADSWMLAPSCRQAWQRPVKDKKKVCQSASVSRHSEPFQITDNRTVLQRTASDPTCTPCRQLDRSMDTLRYPKMLGSLDPSSRWRV